MANQDVEFVYRPNLSTTCIFSPQHPSINNVPSMLRWAHHPHCHNLLSFPSYTVALSSSHGLLLLRQVINDYYCVGNPFHLPDYYTMITPSPNYHPPETHSVLITTGDVYHVVCLVPNPRTGSNKSTSYAVEVYSSNVPYTWATLSSGAYISNNQRCHIIPGTGISCGRWAYWLTWTPGASRTHRMLTRVDIKNSIDPARYPLFTSLHLPSALGPECRMQLGTVGNMVGLVVVCMDSSRVELYLLDQWAREGDNEDCLTMRRWVQFSSVLNVVVDPGMEEGAVEVMRENQIRCREMPEPLRFQSFKMEVLLLVGGRRVVLWEGSEIPTSLRSRLRVIDGREAGDQVPQVLSSWAVPHVSTFPNYSML